MYIPRAPGFVTESIHNVVVYVLLVLADYSILLVLKTPFAMSCGYRMVSLYCGIGSG